MAETIEEDDASWSEVIVTLAISTATSAVFLTIYEVARRNPTLIEVFDRRRATKPNRTPPPLLRFPIFEWLFLSNDPTYSEYSDLAHMRDVIQEKRKQRNPGKSGLFGSWYSGSSKRKKEVNRDEENGIGSTKEIDPPQEQGKDVINVDTSSFGIEVVNIQKSEKKRRSTNSTSTHKSYRSEASSRRSRHSSSTASSSRESTKKIVIRRHLTPDVVEVNGWRLPKEVAEYALANDLTEEQLHDYEERLLEQERLDEIEFQRRRREMAHEWDGERKNDFMGDINHSIFNAQLQELETDVKLRLPPRKSRFWYFGFEHRGTSDQGADPQRPDTASTTNSQRASRIGKPVSVIRSMLSSRYKMNSGINFTQDDNAENAHLNRHLKSVSVLRKRPLSASDVELLRCIGLDTYVMIRFLRFCFDVTFYPFVLACIVLFPSYAYNDFEDTGTVAAQTEGYFLVTINRLEPTSKKLWICWGYTFIYILYILRRLWIEWEIFLPLRFDFLANGDVENEKSAENKNYKSRTVSAPQNDVQLHLEQYRNSCMVEYIPDSHRRDQELYQFFDAVFPGQVKRAEILLNATELTKLIKRRQNLIEEYERVYAKFAYEKKTYWQIKEGNISGLDTNRGCFNCKAFQSEPKKPENPRIHLDNSKLICCRKKAVKALPFYLGEIKTLNRSIEHEYKKVTELKQSVEDRAEYNDIYHTTVGVAKTFLTGEGSELQCDTGFVEFKNLTAKQSALQCNITGTNGFMVLTSAPDPRDIVWDNATVEKQSITVKNAQCGLLLFAGTLLWFAVVGFVTSLSDLDRIRERNILPEWFFRNPDSIWYELVEGYVPVVLLELLMLVVPFILRIVATTFIRFKTHSEIDQFIYKWHFAYRVTNLISIIVRQQVLKTLDLFLESPRATVDQLTGSIALSSQFFLNNMLVSAGTETFFELSQLIKIFRHLIMNRFIILEATSKRDQKRFQEPISLEWGETVPPFVFALLVGSIYSTVVPVVLGACALYFYVAAKIYTHQALFIYAQPYEGGGKLMYLLNRSVFGIVYISIFFFSAILGLKNAGIPSTIGFMVLMIIITYVVDTWITTTFVNPSITLALTNARIIDEETKGRNERKRLYHEFKNAKRRKRKEEEKLKSKSKLYASKIAQSSGKENYLPKTLLPTVSESDSTGSGLSRRSPNTPRNDVVLANRMRLENARKSRSAGSSSTSSSDDTSESTDKTDDRQTDFFLYRQPQLNKTLWETKPRIDNWK